MVNGAIIFLNSISTHDIVIVDLISVYIYIFILYFSYVAVNQIYWNKIERATDIWVTKYYKAILFINLLSKYDYTMNLHNEITLL